MTPTKQEILELIQREYTSRDEYDPKFTMGFFVIPMIRIKADMKNCIAAMTAQVLETVQEMTGMTPEETAYWFYNHAETKQFAGETHDTVDGDMIAYYFGVHVPYNLHKDYDPKFETIH